MKVLRDGGFVTAGRSVQGPTDMIQVNRYRDDGRVLWSRLIDGPGRQVAYSIEQARNGDFIIGAETDDEITPRPFGILLIRLDSAGNTVWARTYPGTPFVDFPSGVRIVETPEGDVAAVGRIRLAATGTLGVLLRTDRAGNPRFERAYLFGPLGDATLSFTDIKLQGVPTFPVEFVVSGYFARSPQFPTAALIMRFDPNGVPVAQVAYAGDEPLSADGLEVSRRRGEIVWTGRLGFTLSPTGRSVIVATDAALQPVWAKDARAFGSAFAAIHEVELDKIVVVGGTADLLSRYGAFVKLDPRGALDRTMRYGMPNFAARAESFDALPCNRGYAIAGYNSMQPNIGRDDLYFLQSNLDGITGCFETRFDPQIQDYRLNAGPIEVGRQDLDGFREFVHTNVPLQLREIVLCDDPGCIADVDDGTFRGIPDGGVTIEDLLYYLSIFAGGDACADVDDGSFTGRRDGGVTIEDLLYFLFRFNAGC